MQYATAQIEFACETLQPQRQIQTDLFCQRDRDMPQRNAVIQGAVGAEIGGVTQYLHQTLEFEQPDLAA